MTYTTIIQNEDFINWLANMKDTIAKANILSRISKAKLWHLGDVESVGEGVFEMRVHIGAGYRIYFTYRNGQIILLLCGGDKSSQSRDIKRAKQLNKQEWVNT